MIDFTYKFLFYCSVFETGISITDNTIDCTVKAPTNYVKTDNSSLAIGSYALALVVSGKSVNNISTISGASLNRIYFYEYCHNPVDGSSETTNKWSTSSALSDTWKNVSGQNLSSSSSVRSHSYYGGVFQRVS